MILYSVTDCSGFSGTLVILDSVLIIESYAFYGSLIIGNSVQTIYQYSFCRCNQFEGTLTIGSNVTIIQNTVFQDFSKFSGSLIIPETVENIGSSAFAGCSSFSGSLIIPKNIVEIGGNAVFMAYMNQNALIVIKVKDYYMNETFCSYSIEYECDNGFYLNESNICEKCDELCKTIFRIFR